MKRLIVDLDGTITREATGTTYEDKLPDEAVVSKLRAYRNEGFAIVVHTARNMRTYKGSIGKINVHTLPGIIEWLRRHDVPFDEVIVGKPWCGVDGFYIDDRAIRPTEFVTLSLPEITALISNKNDQSLDSALEEALPGLAQ